MNNGTLVISLDFELLWGVFDKVKWQDKIEYFSATKKNIPSVIHLFEKFEIECTWATVGMLFNENWEEWRVNIPKLIPEYHNNNLSAYKYGTYISSKETEPLCFAPELIKLISQTVGQEVGTHTYSHYYCLEPGQNLNTFREDLIKAKELAAHYQINLESLVFPRNQFNVEYLDLCASEGIKNIRSNPDVWYWENTQKNNIAQKICRTGDAYFGKNDKTYDLSKVQFIKNKLNTQKASRFLRPYSNNRFLNNLKINRVIDEITYAAINNEIYHLWWHPHNFGNDPEKNLKDLEIILTHFETCKNKYGMQSMNMKSVGSKAIKDFE